MTDSDNPNTDIKKITFGDYDNGGKIRHWGLVHAALGFSPVNEQLDGVHNIERVDSEFGGWVKAVVGFESKQAAESSVDAIHEKEEDCYDYESKQSLEDHKIRLQQWIRSTEWDEDN